MEKKKKRRLLLFLLVLALAAIVIVLIHRANVSQVAEPTTAVVHDGSNLITINVDPNIEVSHLSSEDFTKDSEGNPQYIGSDYTVHNAIDVADYQGDIDWQAVKNSGIEYAIIRCGYRGYTKSGIYEDEHFQENITGATDAGLKVGVYFFSQAINQQEAVEEANFVLEHISGYDVELVVYDWEKIDYDVARTDDMEIEAITSCAEAFCTTVSDSGYTSCIYFNINTGYNLYDLSQLSDCEFWLSDPSDFPDFYYQVLVWQYSFKGTVDGIDGYVDMDMVFTKK